MAEAMLEGVAYFAKNSRPQSVRTIHFIIFQEEMMQTFMDVIHSKSRTGRGHVHGSGRGQYGLNSDEVKDKSGKQPIEVSTSWCLLSDGHSVRPSTAPRTPAPEQRVKLLIHAMSDNIIKNIEDEVEKLYAESSVTLEFGREDELMAIRKLRPAQVCLEWILISLLFLC